MTDLVTDEVVEVAARSWWEHDRAEMNEWAKLHGVEPEPGWDDISDTDREHVREDVVRPTLEAAAPFFARKAWEEGFEAGDEYGTRTDRHLEREGAENGEPHECKRCPVKENPYEEEA